jgi:hypothetical protein
MELFSADDHLEVIGTSAVTSASDEWCIGGAATRALIAADWQSWGDLALDIAGATIHVLGDVAWVATTGMVSQTITATQSYDNITGYLRHVLDDETDTAPDRKLLSVILGAAAALSETRQGDQYTWPIRLTAVLVRGAKQWRFHQVHFSFPTIYSPQVRIT